MWLLDEITLNAMAEASKTVTPEACREYEARVSALSVGERVSRVMRKKGGTASVAVEGVMTARPSFLAFLFGGGNTTYSEITEALRAAEGDDEVEAIDLLIDSPGGSVDGMFDAMADIAGVTKPVRAVVTNKAASAAYGLASQANEIVATSEAVRFGSVGIVASFHVSKNEVTITSTNAPNKRPDVSTEEGQAAVRKEMDAMADLFAERIAGGRGVTADEVNANFGRGGMSMAKEALQTGMIDAISGQSTENTNPAAKSGTKPEATMDLNKLKAEHPDVYAAAVQLGVDGERDRVGAHLELGQAYNAMGIALEAVKSGQDFTATITARYVAAGANAANTQARQEDDQEGDPGTPAGGEGEEATEADLDKKASDDIVAKAFELCGVEGEA